MTKSVTMLVFAAVVMASAGVSFAGSPYSAGGLGLMLADDSGISRSMGGAGIAVADVGNMMRGNPALLGTFATPAYSIGARYLHSETDMGSGDNPLYARLNLDLLKFVFPVWRGVVVSWGLSPYSLTDVHLDLPEEASAIYDDTMKRTGGISVSTAGISFSLKQRVYFGAALNYSFGSIEENWTRVFSDSTMHDKTDYLNKKYHGYSQTLGILVRPLDRTYIGVGFTTRTDCKMSAVLHPNNDRDVTIPAYARHMRLPSELRVGVSSHLGERFLAAVDYSTAQWEKAATTDREGMMYANSYQISGGLRFAPTTRLNTPLLKSIPLSIGFRHGRLYYKSFPKIDDVTETAVSFGVEIPIGKETGRLFNSFEYGVRGSKSSNGWRETFFGYGISLVGVIK
jgi:hypothetical protein